MWVCEKLANSPSNLASNDQLGEYFADLYPEVPLACCSASDRKAAMAASYSRSAASRSGVPGFVLSRTINAAITRSVVFFHSEYQG